ncbi:MFS transporter [Kamptonema cortianum]|nr:MFS transporter [Geitlerinema splendidum]MDK3157022.1 MFS transporter [Kamptonema cortianum]
MDVAFATAFVTLFSGSLLVGFVQYLAGGNRAVQDFWVGMIGAVPAIMGLAQIPGAALGRASTSFRNYIAKGGRAWRFFHLPIVFLPILPISFEIKLVLLVLCLGIAALCHNLVNSTYNEWIGHIVPERNRGWYFSQRTLISTIVGMAAGLIGARVLDVFRANDNASQGFAIIFGIGWVCGMISMFFFGRMSDTKRENTVRSSAAEMLNVVKEPLRDTNFRKVLLFVGIFAISQGFAGNLFAAFALESLKMDFFVLQFTSVAAALGTVLMVKTWGYVADRMGNRPLLILLCIGATFTPLLWVACFPGYDLRNNIILIGGHVFNGIVWSGIGISQMNLYLSTSRPESRANYLASALTINAIALAVSPLMGAFCMSTLRAWLNDPVLAYKTVFLMVVLLRIASLLLVIPIREKGSIGIRETVKQLIRVNPRSVVALRAMRKGASAQSKEDAIRSVGLSQMGIAISDLSSALTDPSPRVRREAAEAMGRIGTAAAARELNKLITENPELIEEETLVALGETRSPEAVETLSKFLVDPSSILRRAAAKALGRNGDQRAIPALEKAVAQPGDPDLRRAGLQALRILESRSVEVYSDALVDQHPSVRIAAAEAVSELEITECVDTLRHSLEWFQDEGASEVAYALGCVGSSKDLEPILRAAKNAIGSANRRRCLLGAARIAGCEAALYRYFSSDEVTRDTNLLQLVRPLMRKDPLLKEAVNFFSNGNEGMALRRLGEKGGHLLLLTSEFQIEESFLLAVLAYTDKVRTQGKG